MDPLNDEQVENKVDYHEMPGSEEGVSFNADAQRARFGESLGGAGVQNSERPIPGEPIKLKPISIGGEFYNSLHPPRLFQNPDGTQEYRGGEKLDKDEVYATRFWEKQPEGMRDAMIRNIQSGVDSIGSFVSPDGIDEEDKEKLSAYRKLAEELGYEVGEYTFDKHGHIASAPLKMKGE